MQARVREWGIDLAPHGKTTMSPQLFQRQLDAGAWGLTFATVTQLAVGVAAGARRTLIANQVVSDADLAGIQMLLKAPRRPAHRVPGRFAGATRAHRRLGEAPRPACPSR
jgi:D-serine dehydratase